MTLDHERVRARVLAAAPARPRLARRRCEPAQAPGHLQDRRPAKILRRAVHSDFRAHCPMCAKLERSDNAVSNALGGEDPEVHLYLSTVHVHRAWRPPLLIIEQDFPEQLAPGHLRIQRRSSWQKPWEIIKIHNYQ